MMWSYRFINLKVFYFIFSIISIVLFTYSYLISVHILLYYISVVLGFYIIYKLSNSKKIYLNKVGINWFFILYICFFFWTVVFFNLNAFYYNMSYLSITVVEFKYIFLEWLVFSLL